MACQMIPIFNMKYLFVISFICLLSFCSNKENKVINKYRVEYWITDYHRKQVIPNILIDTIYDNDILMKSKWIQINKSRLVSSLNNDVNGSFDYADSTYCEIYDSMFLEYADTSYSIKNIVFWSSGGAIIVDITYDPKKGIIMKYYPERGFEILLKRFHYENDKLVKIEDFHDLQERNKSYNEDFYYRK